MIKPLSFSLLIFYGISLWWEGVGFYEAKFLKAKLQGRTQNHALSSIKEKMGFFFFVEESSRGTGHLWKQKEAISRGWTNFFLSLRRSFEIPQTPSQYTEKTSLLLEKHLLGWNNILHKELFRAGKFFSLKILDMCFWSK